MAQLLLLVCANQGYNPWPQRVILLKTPACWLKGFFKEKRLSPVITRCSPAATYCFQWIFWRFPFPTNGLFIGCPKLKQDKTHPRTSGQSTLWTRLFLPSLSQVSSKPGLLRVAISHVTELTYVLLTEA